MDRSHPVGLINAVFTKTVIKDGFQVTLPTCIYVVVLFHVFIMSYTTLVWPYKVWGSTGILPRQYHGNTVCSWL